MSNTSDPKSVTRVGFKDRLRGQPSKDNADLSGAVSSFQVLHPATQINYRGRMVDHRMAMELIIVLLHKCVTVMEQSAVFVQPNLTGERVF